MRIGLAGASEGEWPDIKQFFPPISISHLKLIVQVIQHAWDDLLAGTYSYFADENRTSAALQKQIEKIRATNAVAGYDQLTFETISREESLEDAHGCVVEKRPDLVFRPSGEVPGVKLYYGLFVEAKVIDSKRPVNLYITKGVARFIVGSYAYHMQHALMLAYVLDDSVLPEALDRGFSSLTKYKKYMPIEPIAKSILSTRSSSVYKSTHKRLFMNHYYAPEPIELLHLWLCRPPISVKLQSEF